MTVTPFISRSPDLTGQDAPCPEISLPENPVAIAQELAAEFAATAAERDRQGGTPQAERDRIRASGLLQLAIPTVYGGAGASWITVAQVVREIAKVDASLAHVFSYHPLGVIIPQLYGSEAQERYYYSETARQNWFWCNALNPLDRRLALTRDDSGYRLNGTKSFCSGAKDSDYLPTTAVVAGEEAFTVVVIPTSRAGITCHDDWDNIGQRQTDSGSVTFNSVTVYPEEILAPRQPGHPFQTFRACLAQLNLANIYVGIAQGALAAARDYAQTQTRPWLTSGVELATEDPYRLHRFGELWVSLSGAEALVDRAADQVQAAWEQGWSLTEQQRGDCAVAIATAKVAATQAGLAISNQMFDLMGARATSRQHGFDRYWRNLRTFTLHDPVDYKLREVGNWVLNQQYPTPGFYA
ncbi:MAG: acyl-CoA dehydrogenase family protein [Cyanobacteria bacterium Co-bin13]|nr:acyl-CoA dehydrogenase family protein [Cyanobacteria bacterium Co-bin13]